MDEQVKELWFGLGFGVVIAAVGTAIAQHVDSTLWQTVGLLVAFAALTGTVICMTALGVVYGLRAHEATRR